MVGWPLEADWIARFASHEIPRTAFAFSRNCTLKVMSVWLASCFTVDLPLFINLESDDDDAADTVFEYNKSGKLMLHYYPHNLGARLEKRTNPQENFFASLRRRWISVFSDRWTRLDRRQKMSHWLRIWRRFSNGQQMATRAE